MEDWEQTQTEGIVYREEKDSGVSIIQPNDNEKKEMEEGNGCEVNSLEEIQQYDLNKDVIVCPGLNISFKRGIEQIEIQDGLYNEKAKNTTQMELAITNMPNLKSIKIGKKCFKYIHSFILENLPSLEMIEIGDECFSRMEGMEGLFLINNCPKLQTIELGKKCFEKYYLFKLTGLPVLASIHFGSYFLFYCKEFELKGNCCRYRCYE